MHGVHGGRVGESAVEEKSAKACFQSLQKL